MIRKTLLFILLLAGSMEAGSKGVHLIRTEKIGSLDRSVPITSDMHGIAVSTDSRHIAYIIRAPGAVNVYWDGAAGATYEDIKADSLVFSPDGNHLAYIASQFGKYMVVLDGRPQEKFEDVKSNTLTFSPDSARLAYIAKGFSNWCVVIDGQPGKPYAFIKEDGISFSPDSNHIAYIAGTYDRNYVLLDNREVGEYNMFSDKTGVVWDNSDTFHYIIFDMSRDILVVTYKIQS